MISKRFNSKNNIIKAIFLFSFLYLTLFLASCGGGGGGGGGSDQPPPENILPVADAGQDQFALDSSAITLTGTASDSDGTIASEQWTQIGGPNVDLEGATTSTLRFTAPSTTETLTFSYTVTDNSGGEHSDTVAVYVSKILFFDTFDNDANWIIEDDTGNIELWGIVNEELFQQNNVNSLAFLESYHLGTFAHLDNQAFAASTAFRFSVDVIPRSNANGQVEGNDVGIMFPYADAQNYYRLSMNSRYGFTRLEKRDNTGFTTLAVNSIGYVDDPLIPMRITVEVKADTIIVFIDDEPIFAESNLSISPGTVALYCQDRASFDNVVISDNSLQPMVVVSSPLAHSIALTPGQGNVLAAEAVVLNEPTGSSVVFTLDGGSETASTSSGNLYSAQFPAVVNGEHEVEAILMDADNAELSRDINSVVGVGGNYMIAVGDSITNGVSDEDPTNNDSIDGRTVAIQGFEAQLNDELTASSGLPQIVFNEGIPGDRSSQLDGLRIDSILERHPGANWMLLLIGTNDALAGETEGVFDGHLRNIVNTALTDVDWVYIARVPPIYDTSGNLNMTLDNRITAYNTRIGQFTANPSDNVLEGPDLYQLFLNQFGTLYDPDGLHPNDAGYQAMAGAWHETLRVNN